MVGDAVGVQQAESGARVQVENRADWYGVGLDRVFSGSSREAFVWVHLIRLLNGPEQTIN